MLKSLLTISQRHLLPVLLSAKNSLSILDLSQLAEMPYATTRMSLTQLQKAGLVRSQTTAGKVLYVLNREDEDSRTFLELLYRDRLSKENPLDLQVTDDDVLWNLAGLGAPLVVGSEPKKELPAEEAIALGLEVVRRNPTAARSIPIVLAENLDRLNYPRLRYLAKEANQTRTLGFFLDLTGALSKKIAFRTMAAELLDQRVKLDEPFFKTSTTRYESMLANRKTPKLARKWHFTMNMEMGAFRSFFEKFYNENSTI